MTKLCECGCGEPAPIARRSSTRDNLVRGQPMRFVAGHHLGSDDRAIRWTGGRSTLNGYPAVTELGHPHADSRGRVLEHIYLAAKALGRPLPEGAQVHHVDGDRTNNSPGNLVLCPDQAYHQLLHRRQRALEACGNANWLKCPYCKRYDDPANLYVRPNGHAMHLACSAKYRRARQRRHRELVEETRLLVPF